MLWILTVTFQLYSFMVMATPPVSLTVDPHFGYAPLTVSGKVTIPRDEQNRGYCIHWESPEGEAGLSCKPMEGEASPRTFFYTIKSLPAGHYSFTAVVLRPSGFIESPAQPVQVMSKFD